MSEFRAMRRNAQLLPDDQTLENLKKGTVGVLAVHGDMGYPYAVPVNYVYHEGKIYIHGAKAGHKWDSIQKDPKVSFCVINEDLIVPEELTTYFKSVIVFGHARIVQDEKEKLNAIELLATKFSPEEPKEKSETSIKKSWNALGIICIEIDHMTGKQAIELVPKKK